MKSEDKSLKNQILKRRGSVKHEPNSTRNTQEPGITRTAWGNQVQAAQALLEVIKCKWHKHCLRWLSVSDMSTVLQSLYSSDQISYKFDKLNSW